MAKILVVDDNEQLRDLLKDVVESWGYEVLEASQGRSCLALAQKERPNIILLDVMLPGLSGYEVCQSLKEDPSTHDISIIMVSALTDVEDRIHGFKVGADNFLVKPINYEELRAIVTKHLNEQQYQATLAKHTTGR